MQTTTTKGVNGKITALQNASVSTTSIHSDQAYGACEKPGDTLIFKPKLYKIRFLMLLLFSLCTLSNAFQWMQFSSITSIVTCYYGVSVAFVNLTSVLYYVMFLPFVIPVTWMMSSKGLKLTVLTAAAGNSIGACIQCFSLAMDRFYVVLLTQIVAAITNAFAACPPAYVAAVWFGANEISIACAVGIVFNQLGSALGFIVPTHLVPHNCDDIQSVRSGLRSLAMGQAVLNTLVFLAIVLFYKDRPPTPPSFAEYNKPCEPEPVTLSLWKLFKNWNFFLLCIAYGLNSSVYSAVLTMMNQTVVRTFPGKDIQAGWIGVETVFAGIVGALVSGCILDRSQKFRETSFVLCLLSLLIMVVYTSVHTIKILWMYFIIFGVLGLIMPAYNPVAYEFAAEITYPIPEGSSTTLLLTSVAIFGIAVTMLASWLQQTYGDLASNLFLCSCLGLACFISAFIKCDKKRPIQDRLRNESD